MGMEDKLSAPPDFDGPVRNRKCTDIIFLVAIVAMWIAMTAVGIASVREGDVQKLLSPTDHEGNLCGWDTDFEDLPNLYYVNTEGSGICVESCPDVTDLSEVLCRNDVEDEGLTDDDAIAEAIAEGYCLPQLESVSVVNYCVFTNSSRWDDVTSSDLETYLSRFIADVVEARAYVFGFGFGVAMVVAFLYIGLLQIPFLVSFLVWSCVLLILVALVVLAIGLWVTAGEWDDEGTKDDEVVYGTYVVSVIAMVLAVLWFCLFCFLAKRISLAIGVIKEAGRAIAAMPLIAVWPVLQLSGSIAFMAIWTYYAAYTASLGEITTKTEENASGLDISYKVYSFDDDVEYRGWFLIFCLFWSLNFITAMGQIVIAMSVAQWYFARNKNLVGSLTVVSSVGRTFIFHIGTAAFGGLIVAIVEMIQAVLSYIQKKAKGTGNKPLQYIACCCACCFWCLEKCIRFINKNAYVQTAIFSTNFCTSARKAFFLIARNIARVAAVSILGGFVLTIMTLFVTAVTTVSVYFAMDSNIRSKLNSIAGPTIMTAVLAYYTGKMITSVYGMAITTILQCFVADEELFPPSQQFAENDLKSWVDRHGTSVHAHSSPPPARHGAQSYAVS